MSFIRNETFAQYAWKHVDPDHMVCIVGWDDDYPVSNFNQGTVTEQTKKGLFAASGG
jgi:C1A family cysteine protease